MADYSRTNQLVYAAKVNLNALGDTPIYIPFAKYQVEVMKVSNASTSLASATTTLGLYTAASAGGTAIVTGATANLTPLTTSAKVVNSTIASTDLVTGGPGPLYINVGTATFGSAATVDVLVKVVRWA